MGIITNLITIQIIAPVIGPVITASLVRPVVREAFSVHNQAAQIFQEIITVNLIIFAIGINLCGYIIFDDIIIP